jgi:hypothetical protein
MRLIIAVLVQPFEGYPVIRHRDVPRHLDRSGLQFARLEYQSLARLRGNPVGNVILVNGNGANRWSAEEIFVPQA